MCSGNLRRNPNVFQILPKSGITPVNISRRKGRSVPRPLALHPCLLKLVSFLPADQLGLRSCGPSQREAEAGDGGVAGEVHAGAVFVAGLMVVLVGVLLGLLHAPIGAVAFVLHAFVDGERRNTYAREAEVVRAIEVSSFRMGVGANSETKFFRHGFNRRIESCALGAGDFSLL